MAVLYEVMKQGMSFHLPCTCNPNESYVKNKQLTKMLSVVRIQQKGVFSIMHSYFQTFG